MESKGNAGRATILENVADRERNVSKARMHMRINSEDKPSELIP